jgi:hypothetical protein
MAQIYLYVTSVPPGEAPLWVREKWVGLKLPLAGPRSVGVFRGSSIFGVSNSLGSALIALLSRALPPTVDGYIVNVLEAIEVLEEASPEAAAWWRNNASHLVQPNRRFLFHKQVGHVGI